MATETDNLLDDVRAAAAEIETGAPEPAPIAAPESVENPPVDETPAERTERERDESGRFKAKDTEGKPRETLKLKEQPAADPTQPVAAKDPTAPVEAPKPGEERIAPPVEWKGGGKTRWERLPKEVQQEIRASYDTVAAERAEIAPVKELLDVNREFLVNQAGSMPAALSQLMQFARMSTTVDGAMQLAQHILQARGIDPRALAGGAASPQAQQPADINAVIARAVSQHLQPLQAQIEQRETHQTLQSIDAFRADPKHPYFNDVVDSMADLIAAAKSRGQTMDLETAYQKAVRLDDAIFERTQSDAREAKEAAAREKAEKAVRARGASLRGSPLPGYSPNGASQGATALDDARAAAAEVWGD